MLLHNKLTAGKLLAYVKDILVSNISCTIWVDFIESVLITIYKKKVIFKL
jgi:hypothetical protein